MGAKSTRPERTIEGFPLSPTWRCCIMGYYHAWGDRCGPPCFYLGFCGPIPNEYPCYGGISCTRNHPQVSIPWFINCLIWPIVFPIGWALAHSLHWCGCGERNPIYVGSCLCCPCRGPTPPYLADDWHNGEYGRITDYLCACDCDCCSPLPPHVELSNYKTASDANQTV